MNITATALPAVENRLGPFPLGEGVTARNAAILLMASFSTIGLVTFLNFSNPYMFQLLGIPEARQGALAGLLVSLQEGIQILIGGFLGAWSDRVGRRPVFVAGMLLLALGFVIYPLAPSEGWLIVFRGFYAVGSTAATVMLSTCVAEYIAERVRGRWMGVVGVCNALGVVTMATVLSRLPLALTDGGMSERAALLASFWIFGAAVLGLAALMQWGLQAPGPARPARRSLLAETIEGLAIARHNRSIAVSYLTAFASRGDLVIMTTFISLWVVQAGVAAGLTPSAATARAGMVFGIAQGVALLWSLVMGFLLDRLPRLTAMRIGFGLAIAGYATLGLVGDPLGPAMIPAAMAAGIGEASAIVSAGVLIGQEAPREQRGVVIGVYGLAGSLGMICLTALGGVLFDAFAGGTPFLMMAVVNGLAFGALFTLGARSHSAGTGSPGRSAS